MWVAMMLLLVSCAAEDAPMERVQVTFTAKIPSEADSRSGESFGQGKYVDRLYCAIYEQGDGGWYFVRRDVVERSGDGFSYAPYLLKGNTYKIAFWAMTEGAYEISEDLTRIIIPVNVSCNNHTKEAFAGVSKEVVVDASNGAPIAVELKRPFAMLNFATTMNSAQKAQIKDMTAEVTITSNGGGLAAYYNVSVDYLMGREETVENSSPPADPVTTEGLELLSQLNEDQLDSAIEYMRFLLSQKKK